MLSLNPSIGATPPSKTDGKICSLFKNTAARNAISDTLQSQSTHTQPRQCHAIAMTFGGDNALNTWIRALINERFRLLWLTFMLCVAGIAIYIQTPVELLPRSPSKQFLVSIPNPGNPNANDTIKIDRIVRETAAQSSQLEHAHTEISADLFTSRLTLSNTAKEYADVLRASLVNRLSQAGVTRSVHVMPLGPEAVSAMDLMVKSKSSEKKLNEAVIIEQELIPLLEQVRGIALVRTQGLPTQDVSLRPKPGTAQSTAENEIEIITKISKALEPPALWNPTPHGIVVAAHSNSTESLENRLLPIAVKNRVPLTIGELYDVEKSPKQASAVVLNDSSKAYLIALHTTPNADLVGISKSVRAALQRFNSTHDQFQVEVVADAANYINAAQENVGENLKWGIILTCLCIFFFARNMRYTAITAISIPVSLALTFPFFELFNISRNVMSLAGLTLSVGVVVDATITVLDSMDSAMRKGLMATEAAFMAARENLVPVAMTSLTTLAVFVPILFLDGSVGSLFFDLSMTVILSQTMAFFVAIFIVPILTSVIYEKFNVRLNASDENQNTENTWSKAFSGAVKWLIAKPTLYWTAGLVSLVLAAISVAISPPNEFLPKRVANEFRALSPEASQVENPLEFAVRIDSSLKKMGAQNRLIIVDSDGLRADFSIPESLNASQRSMEEFLNNEAKPFRTIISTRNPIDFDSTNGRDLEFFIPLDTLERSAFKKDVEEIEGVATARWSTEHKQLHSSFNDAAPSLLTLPAPPEKTWDIVHFSHAATLVGVNIPWDENNRTQKPHLVWRSTQNTDAKAHPTLNAATITRREDIIHNATSQDKTAVIVNGEKVENVILKLRGKTVSEVSSELDKTKNKHNTKIIWGVSKLESEKNVQNLAICFLVAAIAIVVFLYWQNRSTTITIVILCTFIWGLIGAFPGLLIHQETLNSSAIVGFILLAGTIVNNGILLMELVVRSRKAQESPAHACLNAVRQRTLPVLITALTTAVGMLPMVWDTGEGSQMYRALSIVVVYGTVVSTPISLLGIPSIYLILYDTKEIFGKLRLRASVLLTTKARHAAKESA